MPRDGAPVRTALLDAAEQLVLRRGFGGTGVTAIADAAGVTKGAFFHHFSDKQALADALVRRWSEADARHLERAMSRSRTLSDDPLQQLLLFVGQFIVGAEELLEPEPGCLFGALCYQEGLLDPSTQREIGEAMLRWRAVVGDQIRRVIELYPPRLPVDPDTLADTLNVTFEGAFIMARALDDPGLLAAQLRHHRQYLALIFEPAG